MLRRKKLLRLGLIPKKPKSREQKKYELMLQEINARAKSKKKDKALQSKIRQDWMKNYANNFPKTTLEPRNEWVNGSTPKKSIFEPVKLDHLDIEDINSKRKQNNINSPIEQAALDAIEQAKEKAKRVAVICHKSGYQYIGENEDARNFGKKSQQMDN